MALKRKTSTPSRVDVVKRRELSWNMSDLFVHADNRFVLHHDADSSETVSVEEAVSKTSEEVPVKTSEEFPVDEKLKKLIDSCDFYLTVFGKSSSCPVTNGQWYGLLGHFELKFTDTPSSVFTFLSCLMEHIKECWLYVDTSAGKHLIYVALDRLSELQLSEAVNSSTSVAEGIGVTKKVIRRKNSSGRYELSSALYFPVETELPASHFDGLQSKKEFLLKVSSCDLQQGTVVVNLYVLEPATFQPNFPCDTVKPRRCHFALQSLIHYFYGINKPCKIFVLFLSVVLCDLFWCPHSGPYVSVYCAPDV